MTLILLGSQNECYNEVAVYLCTPIEEKKGKQYATEFPNQSWASIQWDRFERILIGKPTLMYSWINCRWKWSLFLQTTMSLSHCDILEPAPLDTHNTKCPYTWLA